MPELPEVESVRRSLSPGLTGSTITRATLLRADIVTGDAGPADLLQGQRVVELRRRGKQLAILADSGRVLLVHLGMTGQLRWHNPQPSAGRHDHVHARWSVRPARPKPGESGATLIFRDPRRFGGLWTLPTPAALDVHWSRLGPDALEITGEALGAAGQRSRRAIKALLLDQAALAGVGNIYADEALFAASIHPRRRASSLSDEEAQRLAASVRAVLAAAIDAGGSTLRDYVSGDGVPGGFQERHAVYGRAGRPCTRCGSRLASALIAQRTTVWCPRCQQSSRGVRPSTARLPSSR